MPGQEKFDEEQAEDNYAQDHYQSINYNFDYQDTPSSIPPREFQYAPAPQPEQKKKDNSTLLLLLGGGFLLFIFFGAVIASTMKKEEVLKPKSTSRRSGSRRHDTSSRSEDSRRSRPRRSSHRRASSSGSSRRRNSASDTEATVGMDNGRNQGTDVVASIPNQPAPPIPIKPVPPPAPIQPSNPGVGTTTRLSNDTGMSTLSRVLIFLTIFFILFIMAMLTAYGLGYFDNAIITVQDYCEKLKALLHNVTTVISPQDHSKNSTVDSD